VHTHVLIQTRTHIDIHTYMYINACTYLHTHTYIIYTYVCMHVLMYIYIYTSKEKERRRSRTSASSRLGSKRRLTHPTVSNILRINPEYTYERGRLTPTNIELYHTNIQHIASITSVHTHVLAHTHTHMCICSSRLGSRR